LPEDKQRARDAGMDAVLPKPLGSEELAQALANLDARAVPVRQKMQVSERPSETAKQAAMQEVVSSLSLQEYRPLATAFLRDGESKVDIAGKAIIAGDYKQCQHLSHGLRGAAGTLGAIGLVAVATELEVLVADRCRQDQAQGLLDELAEELEWFSAAMAGYT